MDKRKLNWVTWAVLALATAFVALMLSSSLSRAAHITLPSSDAPRDPNAGDGGASSGALTVVEITPDTVQAAIASLSRPESYSRSVRVEYFWSGGSGRQELYVTVRQPWTRIDRTLGSGQTRVSVTDGEVTYIWYGYDSAAPVAVLPAGDISADDEQSVPTYEDILDLPPETLVQADYRALEGLNCIYVETEPDEAGYALRYWVSVDSGLLVQAEKLLGEELVYRMSALQLELEEAGAAKFVLPDGTALPDREEG